MAKRKEDVCIVVQARLNSTRIPQKMIKPFAGTTLLDILFEKLVSSDIIPTENVIISAYDPEIKEIANKWGVNVFERSKASANEEHLLPLILEYHDKIPYKYMVSFQATHPLMKRETMEKFYLEYINSDKEGLYGVFEKKNHYWDKNGNRIECMSKAQDTFNTKFIDSNYEAGHCLTGTELSLIKDGKIISKDFPNKINPFVVDELEAWDIDEPWQFTVGEKLYETLL